jgi:hypothetical protein
MAYIAQTKTDGGVISEEWFYNSYDEAYEAALKLVEEFGGIAQVEKEEE